MEFNFTVVNSDVMKKSLARRVTLVFENFDMRLENIIDVLEDMQNNNALSARFGNPSNPLMIYTWSGKDFNAWYRLDEERAYAPEDNFIALTGNQLGPSILKYAEGHDLKWFWQIEEEKGL